MYNMVTRGIRNNNPFNIRLGDSWIGLVKGTDTQFCTFTKVEYGIRACYKLLHTYRNKYKLVSISDVIKRFAPSSENNTEAYIKRVCELSNLSPDDSVLEHCYDVMSAMAIIESNYRLTYHTYCDSLKIDFNR